MNFNFLKKYKKIKNEPVELKELKSNIDNKGKDKIFNKIVESEEIDKIIIKLQNVYSKISNQLFIKYDLKNELKQGKLFTILIAILIFLFLIVLTVFFVIMLNSLLGLNLIFSIIKYSIFLIRWSYKILKSKGKIIHKYLANLFPNSKVLNQKEKIEIKNLPIFETYALKEIQILTFRLESLNTDVSTIKELAISLKNIVNSLNLNDNEFLQEFKTLEYKQDIIKRINDIKDIIDKLEKRSQLEIKFNNIKEEITNEIDEMVKVKTLKRG